MPNSVPTLTGVATSITFAENTVNATPQIIDSNVVFTDLDNSFNGGTLAVTGLIFAQDTVSVRNVGAGAGEIGFSAGNVSYEGIVIGTASGGAGTTLTVTFNASASSAAIDALIQNLTYANSSHTPTDSRTLEIKLTDGAGAVAMAPITFAEQTGGDNPFNGVDVGMFSVPSFADLDGDGDLDAVVGLLDGNLNYLRNTGTASAPVFAAQFGAANPFNGVNVSIFSAPSFADLDGDGDFDVVVGGRYGNLNYFRNTGTASAPVFVAQFGAANPFNGVDVGDHSTPSLSDLDGDGDLDAVVGTNSGTLRYFQNTGTATAPVFSEQTGGANPFNGIDVGAYCAPTLADLDGDGDLDALVGERHGAFHYFQNTGTASAPVFVAQTGTANPFNGVDLGYDSTPTFADLDGDGDLDTVVGELDGNLNYFRNTTPLAIEPDYVQDTGAGNPFNGIDVGLETRPTFADVDGDGDLDALVGELYSLKYYQNTGTAIAPVYTLITGAANPFNGIGGVRVSPSFVDLNADGDLDVIIGNNDGTLLYYLNTGSATAPAFVQQTGASNPFNGVDVDFIALPSFADLDSDGDFDAIMGTGPGTVRYFDNTGSAIAPTFTERSGTANPFNGFDVGNWSQSALADVDGDGDLDAAVGEYNGFISGGRLAYLENTGTARAPIFTQRTGTANPFDNVSVGKASAPSFVDLDGDGDLDLVVGENDGNLNYFRNTGSGFELVVNVTAENDAPTATNLNQIKVYNEDDVSVALDNIFVADAEGDQVTATLTLTNPATGVLTTSGTATYTPGTGVWTITGTVANVNQALGSVAFIPAVNNDVDTTITTHIQDASGAGPPDGVITLDATPQPEVPVLTGVDSPATFPENTVNSTPQIIDGDVTFTDLDGDFDGGTLTVTGLLAEDIVSVRNVGAGTGEIGFSAGTVSYEGIAIGTATGSSGATFTIAFNGDATTAAIDALIQNLTYANSSGTSTASRTVTVRVTDAQGPVASSFVELTGAANPFDGMDVGRPAQLALGDLDGDGDLDAVAGERSGLLFYFENTGDATTPAFVRHFGSANPFDGFTTVRYSAPSLADLDGDGDLDSVVGSRYGVLHYFRNAGTPIAPSFVEETGATNPFNGIDVGVYSAPTFADIDGDGLLDAVVGENDGNLNYFRNTGTASAPAFTEVTGAACPFDGIDVGTLAAPVLADFDRDGDLDMIVGEFTGSFFYFQNTGTSTAPVFTAAASPFHGATVPFKASPALGDLDGDGDLDAVVGDSGGLLHTFAATSASVQITIGVTAAADAPEIVNGNSVTLSAIDEDEAAPPGYTTFQLFNSHFSDDDGDGFGGVAIVGNAATAAQGAWQWSPDGTSWTEVGGSLSEANALLLSPTALLRFLPSANFSGPAPELTVRLVDDSQGAPADGTFADLTGGTGGTTPYSAATLTVGQTVNFVNDAPAAVITPASYSATEQTALTLKGTGLSVSDVDAGAGTVTVTLSVVEGTLTATAGDSGTLVSNSGTSSLTIIGSVAQVNAFLGASGTSTLSYIDNTDTPSATTTLTLSVNDNGNTGGGNQTVSDTATINITAVNDAPVITVATTLEIVTSNADPDNVNIFVADGAGHFSPITVDISSSSADPFAVAISDMNGDGYGDIVTANHGTGNVTLLLGDGAGGFIVSTAPTSGLSVSIALGDLDGDGTLDIVTGRGTFHNLSILLNNGDGTFASPVVMGSGGNVPVAVAIADINSDGNPDIVVANSDSDDVGILLGDGTGNFDVAGVVAVGGDGPSSIAVGDVNGDGSLDSLLRISSAVMSAS